MTEKNKISYEIVSETHGHLKKENIEIVSAAEDIFKHVKNKAMQASVKGEFIEFDTVDELASRLEDAAVNNFVIRVYDSLIGG